MKCESQFVIQFLTNLTMNDLDFGNLIPISARKHQFPFLNKRTDYYCSFIYRCRIWKNSEDLILDARYLFLNNK